LSGSTEEPEADVTDTPRDPATTSTAAAGASAANPSDGIEAAIEALEQAQVRLTACGTRLTQLQQRQLEIVNACDETALEECHQELHALMSERRDALGNVRDACQVVAAHVRQLGNLAAGAAPDIPGLVAELQRLSDETKRATSAQAVQRLAEAAAGLRARVLEVQRESFAALVRDIRVLFEEVEALDYSMPETRRLLDEEPYLRCSISDGKQRLENELALVRQRRTEQRQKRAEQAAVRIHTLASRPITDADIEPLTALVVQCEAAPPDRRQSATREALRAIASAPLAFATRMAAWLRLIDRTWEAEEPSHVRLGRVADLLPRPAHGEDVRASVLALLERADVDRDDADTLWPVLASARTCSSRFAQALFDELWGPRPPADALARWLLESPDADLNDVGLADLCAGLHPLEAWAVREWARDAKGLVTPPDHDAPLIEAWIDVQTPCPALGQLQAALTRAGHEDVSATAAIIAVAVATGEERVLGRDPARPLRAGGYGGVADLLQPYCEQGSGALRAALGAQRNAAEATAALDAAGDGRTLAGRPAQVVWQKIISSLGELRRRAQSDPDALAELARLRPESVLSRGCEAARYPDVNPTAKADILDRIERFRALVPIEAGGKRAEVPKTLERPDATAIRREVEVLRSRGAAGRLAARLIERLLQDPAAPAETPSKQAPDEDARRLVETALGETLILHARFRLASINWSQELGLDILERRARGAQIAQAAVGRYLRKNRFELANQVVAVAEASCQAELIALIDRTRQQRREEVRAVLESLAAQLHGALAGWESSLDPQMRSELEKALGMLKQLSADLDGFDPSLAEERYLTLADFAEPLLARCREHGDRLRREVHVRLSDTLQRGLSGVAAREPALVAHACRAALMGDVPGAMRFLELVDTPADDPSRLAALREAAPQPAPAAPQLQMTPRATTPPAPDKLNILARRAWDNAPVPDGFALPRSPWSLTGDSAEKRRLSLLWAARSCHKRQEPEWTLWLGCWLVEEGWESAADGALSKAVDHARDAVWLLAGGASDRSDWALAEALVLWLAGALHEARPAAKKGLEWADLRRSAGPALLAMLVRRFFEARAVDVLADVMVRAAGIAGVVPGRILGALGKPDEHLHAMLLREILRGGADFTRERALAALDLLSGWITGSDREQLEALLLGCTRLTGTDWAMNESAAPILEHLARAGVPDRVREYVEEAFQHRAYAHQGHEGPEHWSCNLETRTVYLSAAEESPDGMHLLVEVSFRTGRASARGVVLSASVEHPFIEAAPTAHELPLLRPGDTHELHIPLVVANGHAGQHPAAQLTLLLARKGATGRTEPLLRRKFKFNVGTAYPHDWAPTPYITGKAVSSLPMIKGRDKEVTDILHMLRGQTTDNFVLIHGMRRIGKSSLLQKLKLDERTRRDYVPAHLDLEYLLKADDTAASLLPRLAQQVRVDVSTTKASKIEMASGTDPYDAFGAFLKSVGAALAPKRLLLLFDEFQMLFERRGASGPRTGEHWTEEFIKKLRYWIQYLPVGFIVAGTSNELKEVTILPGQRLFQLGLTLPLGPLDPDAARALVKEPVKDLYRVTSMAAAAIIEETARLPNLIQIVCHALFDRMYRMKQTVAGLVDAKAALEAVCANEEHFSFLLWPLQSDAVKRALVRVLAEIGVDERRATLADLCEHLRTVRPDLADEARLEDSLRALREHEIVQLYRRRATEPAQYRLTPPLLARHVLNRRDYEL
jgi:hypothetical protein